MLAALIYPHQLYADHPALPQADICVLIEEPLLWTQYAFHAQKLVLHRAAMQRYAAELCRRGHDVRVVESSQLNVTGDITKHLIGWGVKHAAVVDPTDDWLLQRLTAALRSAGIGLSLLTDPHFLTSHAEFAKFAADRPSLYFTEFYIRQRKRLGILLDQRGHPVGGKWSFDRENRKKLPRDARVPIPAAIAQPPELPTAIQYVQDHYPNAPGQAADYAYPLDAQAATAALHDFLEHRFAEFGAYEDAISLEQTFLFHSVLTPALNCGLISPLQVVHTALEYADRVPLNSLEGFIRQIIGWREYIRGVYHLAGRQQRSRNFWGHSRPMPRALYRGTTGIDPVDTVIQRVLRYAYCHHIERLMVLSNFMLLCEIHPDAVYRWFMELFIDAYDWVMVPNVYGMSQFADGGLCTTKPYLSGSNYILKMSNFRKGAWCTIWDALYWRFIDLHRDFFAMNPRMSIMVKQCDRLGPRLAEHHRTANAFLEQLHQDA